MLSQKLCAQDPAGASAQSSTFLKRGLHLAEHGELAQAEAELEQARALTPDDVEVLTALAKVKGRIGELPAAIVIFRQVVADIPSSADAHLNLAIAMADNSDFSNALDESTKAIELSPDLASAHQNRARILADLHRLDEARLEFARASQLAPANPDCFYYWALVEKDSGNLNKESQLLSKVVRLQPQNQKALRLLAGQPARPIPANRINLSLAPVAQNQPGFKRGDLWPCPGDAPHRSARIDEPVGTLPHLEAARRPTRRSEITGQSGLCGHEQRSMV